MRLSGKDEIMGEINFDKFIGAFNARNHPEFRSGSRPDYDILKEFTDSFKDFISLYEKSITSFTYSTLLWFFEFFSITWTFNELSSVIDSTFKIRPTSHLYSLDQTTPFGTSLSV